MDEYICEREDTVNDLRAYWNNAYLKTPTTGLGWYEEIPGPSMELIRACGMPKDALVFNAGAGATTLIGALINEGFNNIIVNDIAASALTNLESGISNHKNTQVKFIVDDLTNPTELLKVKNVDLWHDRAVLHFFTSEKEQLNYFKLLKKMLKPGGFVILAEYNLEGAKKCSGLDIVNYDVEMLQVRLGGEFSLIRSFNYNYTQPSGNKRAYIYTLFQRIDS